MDDAAKNRWNNTGDVASKIVNNARGDDFHGDFCYVSGKREILIYESIYCLRRQFRSRSEYKIERGGFRNAWGRKRRTEPVKGFERGKITPWKVA